MDVFEYTEKFFCHENRWQVSVLFCRKLVGGWVKKKKEEIRREWVFPRLTCSTIRCDNEISTIPTTTHVYNNNNNNNNNIFVVKTYTLVIIFTRVSQGTCALWNSTTNIYRKSGFWRIAKIRYILIGICASLLHFRSYYFIFYLTSRLLCL